MAELRKLGRYELHSVLGKGAMGVVYEGYDPTLGRRVAIKTILKNAAIDDETERAYTERFVKEAKAVGRLNHPNIVQVHDFGVENDVAYLVMEFIQGRELRSYFTGGEKFDSAEVVRIMGELLDALELAHEAGVIHRDIKPANVMLDAQRRLKLADFGVARVQDSDRSAAGTMVGTPAFMSPEQISGGKIDRRTDVFSAGVVLYQLLTGEQPFKGEGAWTVAKQIMQDDPPRPSSMVQSVSPAFDAIVNRALAKKPAERFASARDFAAALRAAHAPAVAALQPKPREAPKASETEIEFWRAIQNSTDAAEFEFYLEQFPEGTYAALARHKIAKLKEGPTQDAQVTVRQEAEAQAKLKAAEEKARLEGEEKARREALEKTRRDAGEKARKETGEKVRQAQALARLKQQQEAARATAAADEDATVAIASSRPAPLAERKTSYLLPMLGLAVLVAGGIGAYLFLGRTPAPAPVAQAPAPPKAEVPAPAPAKAELSAADIDKIRKETEERVRREYADKSAAEQAKAMKAAADKVVQEKQLAAKAAAEKAAQEKLLAAKAAEEKVAAEKLAAEKAAAVRAAAEKSARLVAEKAAEEKAAAAKAAEEKAVAAAKAPPVSVAAAARREVGLPGRYAFRVMPGHGGGGAVCGYVDVQEDVEFAAGGAQSVSGRDFRNLRAQRAQDGSIAATLQIATRWGNGDTSLAGRATAVGYSGTYEWRRGVCAGQWTLVRK